MSQFLASGLAVIIALVLWSTKKQLKIKQFFNAHTNSSSIQLETSSLVQEEQLIARKITGESKSEYTQFIPTDISQNAIETYKELSKLFSSGPEDRLSAISIASDWDNPKAIKFLKRGLKDFDSRVVVAAAAGISNLKGKTTKIKFKVQDTRPPLNVSLMR